MSDDLTQLIGITYVRIMDEAEPQHVATAIGLTGYLLDLLGALMDVRQTKIVAEIEAADADRRAAKVEELRALAADLSVLDGLTVKYSDEILGKMETFSGSLYFRVSCQELHKLLRPVLRIAIRWKMIDIPDGSAFGRYDTRVST